MFGRVNILGHSLGVLSESFSNFSLMHESALSVLTAGMVQIKLTSLQAHRPYIRAQVTEGHGFLRRSSHSRALGVV